MSLGSVEVVSQHKPGQVQLSEELSGAPSQHTGA